ncbi:MAG: DUF1919 domain-containing protein [Clostridiales bacterium]|nr:DUF1919 domain-containing protein [Clostridiales bacterium]
MIEAYIFGAGQEYDRIAAVVKRYGDELLIKGIVTSKKYCRGSIDGYQAYEIREVDFKQTDYVILAVGAGWQEAMKLVTEYVSAGRIIRSKVFLTPLFDLKNYMRLKESQCSILSNFCLGGIVSDQLGLPFLSPTVNMVCLGDHFFSFVRNCRKFLEADMKVYDNDIYIPGTRGTESFMGKGIIDREIVWYFRHSNNPKADVECWNRRKTRVNFDNLAVMMVLFTKEEAELFEKLPVRKKLGLFFEETGYDDIIYIPGWEDIRIRYEHEFRWAGYAQKYVLYPNGHVPPVNWINFLNGEEYLRVR